ncbi:MAG: hypothetical protein WC314_00360 [Vulcanimicrobiota bacterium]
MNRRAVTLVEVIVAFFLTSVLFTVVITVLVPALRAWTDGQKRSELGQSLVVALNWLGDDIGRAAKDSIVLTEQGVLLMKCTPARPQTHEVEFNEVVVYWLDGSDLLRAQKISPDEDPGPPPLAVGEHLSLDTRRRVASGVEVFEVQVPNPWRVEVRMVVKNDDRSAEARSGFSSIYAPLDPEIIPTESAEEEHHSVL